MLGTNLFTFLAGLLSGHFRSRSDETQLRRELLAHRRRQLLHQHIPDVYQAREQFGSLFEDTHAILVEHDPGHLGALAAASTYYPELTRTLLYQFKAISSVGEMGNLIRQETGLWFGRQAAAPPAELAALLYQIRVTNAAHFS